MEVWLSREAADPNGIRIHFPIEIRWTKGDDIWLSPSNGRKTVYIGIVQFRCVLVPVSFDCVRFNKKPVSNRRPSYCPVQTVRSSGPLSPLLLALCLHRPILFWPAALGEGAHPHPC
jgi:hypothetical protein